MWWEGDPKGEEGCKAGYNSPPPPELEESLTRCEGEQRCPLRP